jgi:putative nucleotidyltransferase with HDIG domain
MLPVRNLTRYFFATIAGHDPATASHSWRVRALSLRLARALRLGPARCRAISRGALLHDVGKIAVPGAVLNKREPPSPEERALLLAQHPVTGARLLARAGLDADSLAIVRWHHERWDGQGYPDGLAGDRIPLAARIVAIADVYDALTSDRPYRQKPFRPEDALAFLRSHSGSTFDPVLVLAFVALMTPAQPGAAPGPAEPRSERATGKTRPETLRDVGQRNTRDQGAAATQYVPPLCAMNGAETADDRSPLRHDH